MRYSLAFIGILLFHVCSVAQSYEIEWSKLERSKGRLIYLVPSGNNEFYALRWAGGQFFGGYQVSKHVDLELVQSKSIKLYADNSIANFEGAGVIGDKFAIFLSDRKEGQDRLYMQRYNDELELDGDAVLLAGYDLDRKQKKGDFKVISSSNDKYFGVVWEIPGRANNRDKYGFKIYDTSLVLINEGEYPIPFDPELSHINAHHISNSGDYFLSITEYSEPERKAFQRRRIDYKALHIYHIAEDDGLMDYKLDLGGKRVEAMSMTSDDNNVFIITGIYGNSGESGIVGAFHQRVDLDSEEKLEEGFIEFDKGLITEGWSDREIERAERRKSRGKEEPQLYNYKMREVTILDDGSIVGTMEQHYVQVRTMSDGRSGQTSNTYYYYYNDIIAYRINPEGKFQWVDKIRKMQVSANDGGPYSSYESFVDKGKVYFVFNDDIRNYDDAGEYIDPDRLHVANYSKKRNVVAIASIDLKTGEKERKTFFNRSEIYAIAVPKLFNVNYQTGEVLLYSMWGRKEKFGQLKIDN